MKAFCAIIVLAGALCSLAPSEPLSQINGPAVVQVHAVSQALSGELISARTNIVRGSTNLTSVTADTTTNFTIDAAWLMALLENSFHTNFPAGCQLLLDETGFPPYSFAVSDSTGTNVGFDPRPVFSSSYLSTYPHTTFVESKIQTSTSPLTNFDIFSGTDKDSATIAQTFTYDDTAMTNTADGTSTQFTWDCLIQSKNSGSSTQSNTFYNETVTMQIIGGGSIRFPATNPFAINKTAIFSGSIRAKVSGPSN